MIPPIISFSLPQFWNPRTMTVSNSFGLTVYSSSDKVMYTWNQTYVLTVNGQKVTSGATKGPAVQMNTAASPKSV
jgi:hypothetical protein